MQSVVAPRRGDTELSTPSAVQISSMTSDTPRSTPVAAELQRPAENSLWTRPVTSLTTVTC